MQRLLKQPTERRSKREDFGRPARGRREAKGNNTSQKEETAEPGKGRTDRSDQEWPPFKKKRI